MENQITYVQLSADSKSLCQTFRLLMTNYIAELNQHSSNILPEEFQQKWINSIIAMQGPEDRHLELCYVQQELIGFLYGKMDHAEHNGFVKPGYGYIMEFYVCPQHRHKGYGKSMFLHLERLFYNHGATRMYLTANPITGKHFWEKMGFVNTGKTSPENDLDIYEKAVEHIAFEKGVLLPLSASTATEISNWEYAAPYQAYSFKGHRDEYLLNSSIWGIEQFCLCHNGLLLGQVACQYEGACLWVGWSMAPKFTGHGYGAAFVTRCVEELRRVKSHNGPILLRVAAANKRAVGAYQRAGFRYVKTILDEIAFSDHLEEFWVMELP